MKPIFKILFWKLSNFYHFYVLGSSHFDWDNCWRLFRRIFSWKLWCCGCRRLANSIFNKLLEQRQVDCIGCVVMDELHLISDPRRGNIMELLLAKILFVNLKVHCEIQSYATATWTLLQKVVSIYSCLSDSQYYSYRRQVMMCSRSSNASFVFSFLILFQILYSSCYIHAYVGYVKRINKYTSEKCQSTRKIFFSEF